MIAEYYYDRPQRSWRLDIKDEENNIVDFIYYGSNCETDAVIECAKSEYDIIKVIHVKF